MQEKKNKTLYHFFLNNYSCNSLTKEKEEKNFLKNILVHYIYIYLLEMTHLLHFSLNVLKHRIIIFDESAKKGKQLIYFPSAAHFTLLEVKMVYGGHDNRFHTTPQY